MVDRIFSSDMYGVYFYFWLRSRDTDVHQNGKTVFICIKSSLGTEWMQSA